MNEIVFAMVLLFFTHGTPPTMEGIVVGMFDKGSLCCHGLDIIDKRHKYKSLAFCIRVDREESAVLLSCPWEKTIDF